jgi:SAM-dependent methyltransferase
MSAKASLTSAQLYDLTYYRGQHEDLRFVEFLVRNIRRYAPGPHVLDCACGTGEPGLSLAAFFSMTLSDASPEMLTIASIKAKQRKLYEVPIICASWSELPQVMKNKFDAVICSGNSISQASTLVELRRSLAGMVDVLAENGIIYIDFREDYPVGESLQFDPTEVVGPLRWRSHNLLVIIRERRRHKAIERLKTCYDISGRELVKISEALTRYLPVQRSCLQRDLRQLGLSSIVLLRRPGRWHLTSLIAQRTY